jgi:hypothetical protein
VESILENGDNMLWLEASGREDIIVRPLAGIPVREQEHPDDWMP